MPSLYADRGFISVNGIEMIDVESITVRISDGTKVVPTMTRNRRNKGTVKGNRDINVSFVAAVGNRLGSPKLENIDYEKNDVGLTAAFGEAGDRYTLKGFDLVDTEEAASGVGSEVKKTFNGIALDILDQVGNPASFPLTF
jgi:hypothetical protein